MRACAQIQAAVDSACGDYTVSNATLTFEPTLLALPTSEFVITQPCVPSGALTPWWRFRIPAFLSCTWSLHLP